MKKFKLQTVGLALFIAVGFASCSSDDNGGGALVSKKSFVTAVAGAETGDLDKEIPLTVTFTVDNNCGIFNKFTETTVGTTKTIEVEANYAGSNCGTTPTTKTATYKFKSATAGTYNLKFKKNTTEFITHTIVID